MPDTNTPYHHKDLRKHLLATALEIVSTKGVRALTMRELSRLNNVSRMAAYRHFKNKHDLLCAVAEEGFRTLAGKHEALVAQAETDAMQALVAMGEGYVAFALGNPALYRLMFGPELTREARPASLQEAAGQAFGMLATVVARCQDQGQFRPGSSFALATLFWSLMHGLNSLLMDGQLQTEGYEEGFPFLLTSNLGKQQKDARTLMDLIVDVMFLGLAPRPGGPVP